MIMDSTSIFAVENHANYIKNVGQAALSEASSTQLQNPQSDFARQTNQR